MKPVFSVKPRSGVGNDKTREQALAMGRSQSSDAFFSEADRAAWAAMYLRAK